MTPEGIGNGAAADGKDAHEIESFPPCVTTTTCLQGDEFGWLETIAKIKDDMPTSLCASIRNPQWAHVNDTTDGKERTNGRSSPIVHVEIDH